MKLARSKNILGLLYAVFLALPLFSIAGRVIYTQSNKNAKDSYSGSSLSYQKVYDGISNDVNSNDDLIVGNYYKVNFYSDTLDDLLLAYEASFDFEYITYGNLVYDVISVDEYYYDSTSFYNTTNIKIHLSDLDGIWLTIQVIGENSEFFSCSTMFELDYSENSYIYACLSYIDYLNDSDTYQFFEKCPVEYLPYHFEEVEVTTLDNAFEYSIQKISDNNLGELKFFTWFADLFLDLDNSTNALYVNFINWYFNYALLVSLAYILFMVLMWFVNFVRKLLEKGQDFGQGGY